MNTLVSYKYEAWHSFQCQSGTKVHVEVKESDRYPVLMKLCWLWEDSSECGLDSDEHDAVRTENSLWSSTTENC